MALGLDGSVGSSTGFPHHKRSYKDKTPKYFKECVDAGVSIVNWNGTTQGTGVRTSKENKIINYNLYNDIVSKKEMDRVMNPFGIDVDNFPAIYRNYPLLNPSINLLCGEERKRIFNPQVTAINADAATDKLRTINDEFAAWYVEKLIAQYTDEKQIQKEMQEFSKWAKFSYKDKRERMGTQVLNYLYNTLDLKEEFSRGFKDALIAGEELYSIEIHGGEPRLRRINPLNLTTLRSGESYKIEESDLIIEDSYESIGTAVDRYYDYLKPDDIKKLEEGFKLSKGLVNNLYRDQLLAGPVINGMQMVDLVGQDSSGIIAQLTPYFGGAFDSEGNVRITRVLWRGLRMLKVLYLIDDQGNITKEILPEQYEPKTELGEQLKTIWVNEWYEGTRIGNDIYVKMQPCEVQMRHRDNLSYSSPGIIGTVYNTNSSKGRSLMDIGKDYQYLWNTFWYRTELGFAKYKGKIGKLNLHLIPDFQDINSALYFAEYTGWMLQDKFNESNRGLSKGKLAGAMNEGSDVIDLEMGNYIQHHINMLTFIKQQVDDLTGITPQRRGAIDNRETVGGVERSVMQSSHITEEWFSVHDNTKVRALRALLEAAKIAWDGQSFVREFVLDDGTKAMLDFDHEVFVESSYGVDVSNTSNDMQTLQAMRQLGERIAQIDGGLTILAEMYRTKDIASLHRKIEEFETNRAQMAQEQAQMEQETQQAQIASVQELEMMKLEIEREEKELDRQLKQYEIDSNNETKIMVAEITSYIGMENKDANDNGIPDPIEIADQSLREREARSKEFLEQRKLDLEARKLSLEEKKLEVQKQIQKQKDDAAMERERVKAKAAKAKKPVTSK